MASKEIKTRIKHKRDTSANWEKQNPVLLNGEIILVDTNSGELRSKTGDGVKTYTQLPFNDEVLRNLVNDKVGKEVGKGLSSNDFSDAEKEKLAGIDAGANAYTHPTYTAKSSGLYKVTVNNTGHVSATTAVGKSDITALGIPGSDTTYSAATASADGLMSATDKSKLNGIASGAEVNQNAFSNITVGSTTIAADGKTDTLTLAGSNVTLTPDAANDKVTIGITKANVTDALGYTPPTTDTQYKHPTYTAKNSGLYKVTVDSTGHVSATTAVSKSDITALGIPSADTDTHYASKNVVGGSASTSNTTSALTNGNVYLNSVENGAVTSSHKISGSGATTVTTDASGNIVISSTDTNTTYTHPTYTAKSSGLYKVTVDGTGHVSATSAVAKSDITALGIPSSNTTYSAATTSADGLMTAADKTKLNGIATGANAYTLPTASSSTLGGVKTTSTVTSTSGLTACPIISGVPYYSDTNTTYSAATTSAAGLMSASDKSKLNGIATGANAYTHPSYTARTGVPTSNQTPAHGGSFSVSQPVSDETGHITAINSRTITLPSETSLSTGSSTSTGTLSYGGTFKAITGISVSGHKITPTTTTYTLPAYSHDHAAQTLKPVCLEMNGASGHGGYIDFHFGQSTDDYTARIIEDAKGTISISSNLHVNSKAESSTLAVSGTATIGEYLTLNGSNHQIIHTLASGSIRQIVGSDRDRWVLASYNSSGTWVRNMITVLTDGTVQIPNGVTTSSDERLKNDWTDLDKYDRFFDDLNPTAYKYIDGDERYHIGFGAQSVESALEANGLTNNDFAGLSKTKVSLSDESWRGYDEEYGLTYTEFIALNTYQIQKLKAEVTDLRKELEELKVKIGG